MREKVEAAINRAKRVLVLVSDRYGGGQMLVETTKHSARQLVAESPPGREPRIEQDGDELVLWPPDSGQGD